MELLNSMSKRGVLFGVLIPACGVSVHHTHETTPEHPPASAVLASGDQGPPAATAQVYLGRRAQPWGRRGGR